VNKIKSILAIVFLCSVNAAAGEWTSAQSNEVWTAIGTLDAGEQRDPGKIFHRLVSERLLVTARVTQVVNDPAYWTVVTAATNVNGTGSFAGGTYTPARRYNKVIAPAVYKHRITFEVRLSQIKKILRNNGP